MAEASNYEINILHTFRVKIIFILLLLLTNLHLKLLSTQGIGANKLLSTQRVNDRKMLVPPRKFDTGHATEGYYARKKYPDPLSFITFF